MNQDLNKPRAILVDVIDLDTPKEESYVRLNELENLVTTYGGVVIVKTLQKRGFPDYETFIGKGKIEEIIQVGKEHGVNLIIMNNILKPSQIYNLNELLRKEKMEAWDRIDLILKIFDKHAQSTEAKLQIELAAIRHMGPRIYGMGMELAQQRAVRGTRSGRGETNIEVMKRHLRRQEDKIMEKLAHYDLIRKGHRIRRQRSNLKTVAIVGYTNAGKSSLLNALTKKGAYVADQLFATLDTRVGKLYVENENNFRDGTYQKGEEILFSDTIGFIRDLPPDLIQAFKSTLSETVDSDLILHVIDVTDPEIHKKIEVVEEILDELELHDKPKIYVFNKTDLIPENHENYAEDEAIIREKRPSLLKAGKETARLLGWSNYNPEEILVNGQRIVFHDQKKLKQQYKKFDPVFVSANRKQNLEKLINVVTKKLISQKNSVPVLLK